MNEQTGQEQEPTECAVPLTRLAMRAIQQAQEAFQKELAAIIQMEAEDRGIPETARFDGERGVFIVPA